MKKTIVIAALLTAAALLTGAKAPDSISAQVCWNPDACRHYCDQRFDRCLVAHPNDIDGNACLTVAEVCYDNCGLNRGCTSPF